MCQIGLCQMEQLERWDSYGKNEEIGFCVLKFGTLLWKVPACQSTTQGNTRSDDIITPGLGCTSHARDQLPRYRAGGRRAYARLRPKTKGALPRPSAALPRACTNQNRRAPRAITLPGVDRLESQKAKNARGSQCVGGRPQRKENNSSSQCVGGRPIRKENNSSSQCVGGRPIRRTIVEKSTVLY